MRFWLIPKPREKSSMVNPTPEAIWMKVLSRKSTGIWYMPVATIRWRSSVDVGCRG
jgi:hypothetical protein